MGAAPQAEKFLACPPPPSPTAEGPSRIPSGKAEGWGQLEAQERHPTYEALLVQWQKGPWQRAPPTHP